MSNENKKRSLEYLEKSPPKPRSIIGGDADDEPTRFEKYVWGPVSIYTSPRDVPEIHPWRDEKPMEEFFRDPEKKEKGAWIRGVAIPEPWDKVRRIVDKHILTFLDRPTDENPYWRFPPQNFPAGYFSIEPDEKNEPFLISLATSVKYPRMAEEMNLYVGHSDLIAFGFFFRPFTPDPSEEWPPDHTDLFCWWYVNPDADRYGHPLARMEFARQFRNWVQEKAEDVMGGEEREPITSLLPWEDRPPLEEDKESIYEWIYENGPHMQDIGFISWGGILPHVEEYKKELNIRQDYRRWRESNKDIKKDKYSPSDHIEDVTDTSE